MSQAGYSQARWQLLVVAVAAALLLVVGVLRLFWGPYTLNWPGTQPARPAVTPAPDSPASREAANSTTPLADGAAQPITARVETATVPHSGDAAEDVAVWVHPTDPSRSTVIATDKKGGLAVYDLAGQQLQYYRGTQPNNVDLRYNFPLADQRATIVATSDLSDETIKIYALDPATRALRDVTARRIATGIDAYGLCMYRSARTGSYFVFLSDEDGTFQQWELFTKAQSDRVDARKVRTLNVGSRSEGCVADDELGALYIAQKEVGLWKYGAEPTAGETRTQVDSTERGSGHLVKDVEGVTLYHRSGGAGYLIVSSQGSNDYAVYERGGENRYLTRFSIASGTVDRSLLLKSARD
jgi:3-phytase